MWAVLLLGLVVICEAQVPTPCGKLTCILLKKQITVYDTFMAIFFNKTLLSIFRANRSLLPNRLYTE